MNILIGIICSFILALIVGIIWVYGIDKNKNYKPTDYEDDWL